MKSTLAPNHPFARQIAKGLNHTTRHIKQCDHSPHTPVSSQAKKLMIKTRAKRGVRMCGEDELIRACRPHRRWTGGWKTEPAVEEG